MNIAWPLRVMPLMACNDVVTRTREMKESSVTFYYSVFKAIVTANLFIFLFIFISIWFCFVFIFCTRYFILKLLCYVVLNGFL